MLAGCGGPQAPEAMPQSQAATRYADRGQSWMLPEAKTSDLLYVANDGNQSVTVYSYPQGQLVGKLTGFGFNGLQGLCSDPKGNVFVTNYYGPNIVEFAHGGTSPIAKLVDPGFYPFDCSIDPTTGNLAAANGSSSRSSNGNTIAIYQDAKGKAKIYKDPYLVFVGFCGYDQSGNLFIDGQPSSSGGFALTELPSGSHTFKRITLNQTIGFPGDVHWTNGNLAVGDQEAYANVIYEFSISGKNGKLIGSTLLRGPYDVQWFWIQDSSVIATGDTKTKTDLLKIWNYPAGGAASKTITDGITYPAGVTVSVSN